MLAQISIWEMIAQAGLLSKLVMVFLAIVSVFSWTMIFSKWQVFQKARGANASFLRSFRKADALPAVAQTVRQYPLAPLVSVFEFGYEEVDRQVRTHGTLRNRPAIERALQLGAGEEMTKLERSMNWIASVASISPFIGLFGTVWGIINAFSGLGEAGSASLRAVAPGISEALLATALGLFAAIPAAVAYNYFSHMLREMSSRMDDFGLEFMNMTERMFGE
ncbi:MAG: MotA/TolQ/ExbB proton channel family protein [Bryobacteraceae bacterium]